jgi:transmembrane 9 superfamily protein 2/4
MLEDQESCLTLCTINIPAEDAKFINERIRQDYAINMLIDQLPAAESKMDNRTKEVFYDIGKFHALLMVLN